MRHNATKHVFTYWRRLCGKASAPERQALNPVDLGRHLANILLLERAEDGTVVIRIAGSRVCALFGRELRGVPLADLFIPLATDDLAEMLSTVSGDCLPVIGGISALLGGRLTVEAELLLMPLLHNGGTEERMLAVLSLSSEERTADGSCHGFDILTFRVLTDETTRYLHPAEPILPFGTRVRERRGHLTVLDGGRA